jgi:methyltransferase (TIGR00027 family)
VIEGQPSRTALSAAAHRAAHQEIEASAIFRDPLALPILGPEGAEMLQEARSVPQRRPMRIFIASRSRYAEDCIAHAMAAGLEQLVVLGAGLDTFAYRNPFAPKLHVIEVDHPSTQAWKRQRLEQAGIAIPPTLRYAPIDFERETLSHALQEAGFDPTRRSFFMWLGVVPYLTETAIFATLRLIAAMPGGAEVVFDYGDPPDTMAAEARDLMTTYAARVAAMGESWISFFEADDLRARLLECGFNQVEDLGLGDLAARYFPHVEVPAGRKGGHVVRAAKV